MQNTPQFTAYGASLKEGRDCLNHGAHRAGVRGVRVRVRGRVRGRGRVRTVLVCVRSRMYVILSMALMTAPCVVPSLNLNSTRASEENVAMACTSDAHENNSVLAPRGKVYKSV